MNALSFMSAINLNLFVLANHAPGQVDSKLLSMSMYVMIGKYNFYSHYI